MTTVGSVQQSIDSARRVFGRGWYRGKVCVDILLLCGVYANRRYLRYCLGEAKFACGEMTRFSTFNSRAVVRRVVLGYSYG